MFVINVKAPSGSRISVTEAEVAKVEALIRQVVPAKDLRMILSNIGVTPDFSAIYTSNSAEHTAFVQVALKDDHKVGSYEYMAQSEAADRRANAGAEHVFPVRRHGGCRAQPGLPAPIDVQVAGSNLERSHQTALDLAAEIQRIPGVADVYIPQDVDYPALKLDVDRTRASELGLDQQEVVGNVITALTSNQMIAPSFWVDPKSGQDYMLTVQYTEGQVKSLARLASHSCPGRGKSDCRHVSMRSVRSNAYRRRLKSIITRSGASWTFMFVRWVRNWEALRIGSTRSSRKTKVPEGLNVTLRGMVQGMRASFRSFAIGLILSVVLLYLILVAQFRSFVDPLLILLAVPPGLTGVLLTLWLTGTTLNVMSLMGVVMLTGIAVSNSILIVEFTRELISQGMAIREAVAMGCRVRLRPVLMTSLATIIGLLPMALKLGEGSESYAPLARALLGGLAVSVALTVFLVPSAYLLVHGKEQHA